MNAKANILLRTPFDSDMLGRCSLCSLHMDHWTPFDDRYKRISQSCIAGPILPLPAYLFQLLLLPYVGFFWKC